MKHISYKEIGRKAWDEYISMLTGSTYKMTSVQIEFIIKYAQGKIENKSFLIIEKNIIIGCVILIIKKLEFIQHNKKGKQTAYADLYIDRELPYEDQELFIQSNMCYIFTKLKELSISECTFFIDPLINLDNKYLFYNHNFLLHFGIKGKTVLRQILDLREKNEDLLAEICNGDKGTADKINNNQIEILEPYMKADELQKKYSVLISNMTEENKRKCEYVLNFLLNQKGVFILSKSEEQYVGAAAAVFYNETASLVFCHGLYNIPMPDTQEYFILSEMTKYLKNKKINFLETGTKYVLDGKIGGFTVPEYSGILNNI